VVFQGVSGVFRGVSGCFGVVSVDSPPRKVIINTHRYNSIGIDR